MCVKRIHYRHFLCRLLTHFEKTIHTKKLSAVQREYSNVAFLSQTEIVNDLSILETEKKEKSNERNFYLSIVEGIIKRCKSLEN